jgi:hypothetical protein
MAKQSINLGSSPNDGAGDTIRDSFDICNDNADELYGSHTVDAGATITYTDNIDYISGDTSANTNGHLSVDCANGLNSTNGIKLKDNGTTRLSVGVDEAAGPVYDTVITGTTDGFLGGAFSSLVFDNIGSSGDVTFDYAANGTLAMTFQGFLASTTVFALKVNSSAVGLYVTYIDATTVRVNQSANNSAQGMEIGFANAKLGFYATTPVVQPVANADTSGATLGQLETEVNELKQILRDLGLMAP